MVEFQGYDHAINYRKKVIEHLERKKEELFLLERQLDKQIAENKLVIKHCMIEKNRTSVEG